MWYFLTLSRSGLILFFILLCWIGCELALFVSVNCSCVITPTWSPCLKMADSTPWTNFQGFLEISQLFTSNILLVALWLSSYDTLLLFLVFWIVSLIEFMILHTISHYYHVSWSSWLSSLSRFPSWPLKSNVSFTNKLSKQTQNKLLSHIWPLCQVCPFLQGALVCLL